MRLPEHSSHGRAVYHHFRKSTELSEKMRRGRLGSGRGRCGRRRARFRRSQRRLGRCSRRAVQALLAAALACSATSSAPCRAVSTAHSRTRRRSPGKRTRVVRTAPPRTPQPKQTAPTGLSAVPPSGPALVHLVLQRVLYRLAAGEPVMHTTERMSAHGDNVLSRTAKGYGSASTYSSPLKTYNRGS